MGLEKVIQVSNLKYKFPRSVTFEKITSAFNKIYVFKTLNKLVLH